MPSKNIGKTIKKVKTNKKNVVITFSDGSKIDVCVDVLANFYLYEGKNISNKEINQIKEFSSYSTLLNYAFSLLRKRHYSEWKMREKLYAKEENKKAVDKIIKILKNNDLIDDAALAEDLKEYLNEKNYGEKKILQYLNQEGIFPETLKNLKFPVSEEKQKAINNLSKLEKRYDKYPYEQKKKKIYDALLNLGFSHDVAIYTLNKIKDIKPKEEKEKLDKDFVKALHKYENKYEGKQLKEKIIASLRNKGYKMKDILLKVGNYDGENDCGF